MKYEVIMKIVTSEIVEAKNSTQAGNIAVERLKERISTVIPNNEPWINYIHEVK